MPTSIFGASLVAQFGPGFAQAFRIYYLILVLAGLGSFALNRRRFAWSRFLVFAMVSLVCGLSLVYTAGFAAVLAGVLALNGQEWYHDTLGTEGRLGGGWVFWSTGGRLLTIGVIFGAIFQATTGWGGQVGGSRFGFGFDPDDFPFEAADTAAATPIAGNFLNTTLAQGDALVWRTAGKRKAYLDSKAHLYSPEVLREFEELRRLIRDDKAAEWAPILDRSQIAAVMIQTANAPRTYAQLMDSPNWVPFHDDGSVSMFGRTDSKADPADVAYFQANRLDATELAFQRPKPVPPWFGTPRAVSELVDSVFQNRLLNRTPPHVDAAQHWLRPVTVPAGSLYMPDPAHCLLAIRELRSALSSKPDDYTAFRLLAEAYRLLLAEESALLAGIEPTQANIERILKAAPQPRLLSIRVRQLLTALNFSILTMPPSKTSEDRLERVQLNYSIAQLDIQTGALDLARERLLAILAVETRPGELTEAFLKDLTKLLGDLNQRIEGVQTQINDLTIQRRASPLEKANFARTSGAQGLAILELVEANEAGSGQGLVRPTLLDLYADTGQPEKALDLVANLNIDDPTPEHRRRHGDLSPGTRLFSGRRLCQCHLALDRAHDSPDRDHATHSRANCHASPPPWRTRRRDANVYRASRKGRSASRLGVRAWSRGAGRGTALDRRRRPPPEIARARTQPRDPAGDRLLSRATRADGPSSPTDLGIDPDEPGDPFGNGAHPGLADPGSADQRTPERSVRAVLASRCSEMRGIVRRSRAGQAMVTGGDRRFEGSCRPGYLAWLFPR